MPFLDIQSWLGINLDQWNISLSSKQPFKQAARCHAFEKEWLECAKGIGEKRANHECQLEKEDLQECLSMDKTFRRLRAIKAQKSKLIEEGTYTPPEHHKNK